jgi:hypothetical protein
MVIESSDSGMSSQADDLENLLRLFENLKDRAAIDAERAELSTRKSLPNSQRRLPASVPLLGSGLGGITTRGQKKP